MKKILTISLLTTVSLLGCSQENTAQKPTANNQAEATQTEASKKNNTTPSETPKIEAEAYKSPLPDTAPTYKVVTTGKQPPYSFLSESGTLQGIDIDVIRLIGEKQGFKVEFFTSPWQKVFPSVVSGERDMAISGISYNTERNEKYTLSKSYLFVPSAIMYSDSSLSINGLKDLEGHRYAGMTGSKQLNDVKKNVENVEIKEVKTMFDAFTLLIQGKTDAIAEDIHWLQYISKSFPEHKMNIVPYETRKDLSSQQIVMFKKGNNELQQLVNEGIDKLVAEGKIDDIEKKWVGE